MMEDVGVGPADAVGNRFQRHRLRTGFEQQVARGRNGRGAAFIGLEAAARSVHGLLTLM